MHYSHAKWRGTRWKLVGTNKDHTERESVSIMSDGWSDSQIRSLINIMTVNKGGPVFLNTVNAEGKTKNTKQIQNFSQELLKKLAPKYTASYYGQFTGS